MALGRLMARELGNPSALAAPLLAALWNRRNATLNDVAYARLGLQPDDRVLEVGFGGGYLLGRIAAALTTGFVAGVDVSPAMVALCRRRYRSLVQAGRLELHCAPAESLPYPAGHFSRLCTHFADRHRQFVCLSGRCAGAGAPPGPWTRPAPRRGRAVPRAGHALTRPGPCCMIYAQCRRAAIGSVTVRQEGSLLFGIRFIKAQPTDWILHYRNGVIVSTGLGSTGWLRSILAGAAGVAAYWSARKPRAWDGGFPWDAPYLYYTVREPFPSRTTAATLTCGKVTADCPLSLVSQMPEHGVIFSDGIESDFLQFNSGTRATIRVAEKKGHLVAG